MSPPQRPLGTPPRRSRRRDADLRLVARTTRGVAALATVGALVFAGLAARSQQGVDEAHAAVRRELAARRAQRAEVVAARREARAEAPAARRIARARALAARRAAREPASVPAPAPLLAPPRRAPAPVRVPAAAVAVSGAS